MNRPTQEDGRVHGVIVGVQNDAGLWLLIRRGENVAAPLKVCFPGGAVESGEDRDVAAVREVREELGLEVELVDEVWRHAFTDRNLTLYGYLAKWVGGTIAPDPHEVAEVLCLTCEEAGNHPDAMPMTYWFVKALEVKLANIKAGVSTDISQDFEFLDPMTLAEWKDYWLQLELRPCELKALKRKRCPKEILKKAEQARLRSTKLLAKLNAELNVTEQVESIVPFVVQRGVEGMAWGGYATLVDGKVKKWIQTWMS